MSPKFGIRELPKMPEFGGCEMRGDIGRTPIKTQIMKHAMPLFLVTQKMVRPKGGVARIHAGSSNHHLYKRFGGFHLLGMFFDAGVDQASGPPCRG